MSYLTVALHADAAHAQDAAAEPPAVERAREQAGDRAASELLELRFVSKHARQLFGDQHVSLIPLVMMRSNCGELCGDEIEWRAAGAVHFPLLGAFGARPATFWPAVQTDDEATAYLRFERRARDLSQIVALGTGAVTNEYDEARAESQYQILAATFADVLKATIREGQARESEAAAMMLHCLQDIARIQDPALRLRRLDELWDEYEYLYGKDNYRRRHSLLLGPVVGMPFDEHIGKQLLVGLAAELGDRGWGISLMVGMPWSWQDELFPRGLWVGIGFTGEPMANLIHGVNGAADWAAKL